MKQTAKIYNRNEKCTLGQKGSGRISGRRDSAQLLAWFFKGEDDQLLYELIGISWACSVRI